MKCFKLISCLAALLLIISLCFCAQAETEKADWTILMYFCGTNLESVKGHASENLNEVMNATDSDKIHVVIETGGASEWKNGIDAGKLVRYVREGDILKRIESLDSASMGSPETLQSFITWGLQEYPAEHVGLILWDHGGCSVDGVCFDELYDKDSLTLPEIGSVLKKTSELLPGGFEFIGFDACLMASLECAATVSPYARYLYASEELEPGTGWDYRTLLTWLAENPKANGLELGAEQCKSYSEFHSNDPSTTFSVVDLSKVDAFVTAFEAAAKEINEAGDDAAVVRSILKVDAFGSNSRTTGYTDMVDIKKMLIRLSDVAPSASAAVNALEDAVVLRVNGRQHYGVGGLSIYYPICVRGTMEIPEFKEICPSSSYFAFVSRISENAELSGTAKGSVLGKWDSVEKSTQFNVTEAHINENGTYTAVLESMENLARATCVVYYYSLDETKGVYLGEDDNVAIDTENRTVSDRFNGTWETLNGQAVPLEMISRNEMISVYTAPIMMSGKEMNLRFSYSWANGTYTVDGVCRDVDAASGEAGRTFALETGDTFSFCYYDIDSDNNIFLSDTSNEITVDGDLTISNQALPTGYYTYTIILYDLSGNGYALDKVTFMINEDGKLTIPWSKNPKFAPQ